MHNRSSRVQLHTSSQVVEMPGVTAWARAELFCTVVASARPHGVSVTQRQCLAICGPAGISISMETWGWREKGLHIDIWVNEKLDDCHVCDILAQQSDSHCTSIVLMVVVFSTLIWASSTGGRLSKKLFPDPLPQFKACAHVHGGTRARVQFTSSSSFASDFLGPRSAD